MKILIYANCQGDGVKWFLRKTPLADIATFDIFHNFRLILLEQDRNAFFDALGKADLIIYQPTLPLDCRDGFQINGTDKLFDGRCVPIISFAYQFNHGFFPILKVAPGPDGWIGGLGPGHGCARRFIECLAEQSRREQECDVPMVDFILANYRKQRLFLTQNHPSSAMFVELATRIYKEIARYTLLPSFPPLIPYGINDADLPGTLPVHPVVVEELGLEYSADTDQAPFEAMFHQLRTDPHR